VNVVVDMECCPNCGFDLAVSIGVANRCEINGCKKEAKYRGWKKESPMLVNIQVCEDHKTETIGGKLEAENEYQINT
jgi:hypothetical protein